MSTINNSPREKDTNDYCIGQIIAANSLEKAGKVEQAIVIYEEVLALDGNGTYGGIARKALESLNNITVISERTFVKEEENLQVIPDNLPIHLRWQKWFYNLPIRRKQFTALLTAELISVLGLAAVGSWLIVSSGYSQLKNQAESELEVTQINYDVKINQMGFGFAANAERPIFIAAAATGKPTEAVQLGLLNEMWRRKMEIATIVDRESRIVVSANFRKRGTKFDPHGLVTKAMAAVEQIKSTEIISYDELSQESPRFAELRAEEMGINPASKPNFLIRYTVTPLLQQNGKIVGAIISGDVVKPLIAEKTVESFHSGYSAIYLREAAEKFTPVTSYLHKDEKEEVKTNIRLTSDRILEQASKDSQQVVKDTVDLDGQQYTLAAKALYDNEGNPVGVLVRGTSHYNLNRLILYSLALQAVVLLLAMVLNWLFAVFLGKAIVNPLEKLQQITKEFSEGNRLVRAEAFAKDEIGELTETFNQMADSIVASEANLAEQSERKEKEAQTQRQEKEKLQQEVIKLLLEIEEVQRGDLTIKAEVTEGAVGSIADAFNTTIRSLRQLVLKVQNVSERVTNLAQGSEQSVGQLSQAALGQASEIQETLSTVGELNLAIQNIADSAREAATIARQTLTEAERGDSTMDRTVETMEKIRTTVASTSKKMKQLAESSQEISQIVGIISGISEKTNLLAFNASIEAARAGENGQGFRVVADEVRRLADRVTDATKEIQQLVTGIQQETGKVLREMEVSTAEVVTGTELVAQTKQTLQELASTSAKIDEYLQTISGKTTEQTSASRQVNEAIQEVASVAQETSGEAQDVANVLQSLVEEAKTLESSVAQFRV